MKKKSLASREVKSDVTATLGIAHWIVSKKKLLYISTPSILRKTNATNNMKC